MGVSKSAILTAFTRATGFSASSSLAPFSVESEGIDFFMSPERSIFLDTQPLPSAEELQSALRVQQWLSRERDCVADLDAARATLIRALRLTIFTLAVSDSVLFVLDAEQLERSADTHHFIFLLRLLAESELVMEQCGFLTTGDLHQKSISRLTPTIIFVFVNVSPTTIRTERFGKLLVSISENFTESSLGVFKDTLSNNGARAVNMALIPQESQSQSSDDTASNGNPYSSVLSSLKRRVLFEQAATLKQRPNEAEWY
jgi:hypothetical protein